MSMRDQLQNALDEFQTTGLELRGAEAAYARTMKEHAHARDVLTRVIQECGYGLLTAVTLASQSETAVPHVG